MRVKKVNSYRHNDFYADYTCEHCKAVELDVAGYNDQHFHENVIPKWYCKSCGKNRAGILNNTQGIK